MRRCRRGGQVHGHGHGAWARHTNRTAKTCLALLLAYRHVRLLRSLLRKGQWRRHSGFRLSLSVSHRRSQFLCGLFAPELRGWLSARSSRLTSHGSRLTFHHSRRTRTRGGPCTLKAAAATPCPCSSSGQDAPRSFGIVSFSRFQPPPEPYPFFRSGKG